MLIINEAGPFVDYVYSCNGINQERVILDDNERGLFLEFVKNKIKNNGNIIILSNSGMFISRNI